MTPIRWGRPRSSGSGPGLGSGPWKTGSWWRLVSVAHGRPPCGPSTPRPSRGTVARPPDALDRYGTWKGLDALMGCAFAGRGASTRWETRPSSGSWATWSDGVPVHRGRRHRRPDVD